MVDSEVTVSDAVSTEEVFVGKNAVESVESRGEHRLKELVPFLLELFAFEHVHDRVDLGELLRSLVHHVTQGELDGVLRVEAWGGDQGSEVPVD